MRRPCPGACQQADAFRSGAGPRRSLRPGPLLSLVSLGPMHRARDLRGHQLEGLLPGMKVVVPMFGLVPRPGRRNGVSEVDVPNIVQLRQHGIVEPINQKPHPSSHSGSVVAFLGEGVDHPSVDVARRLPGAAASPEGYRVVVAVDDDRNGDAEEVDHAV